MALATTPPGPDLECPSALRVLERDGNVVVRVFGQVTASVCRAATYYCWFGSLQPILDRGALIPWYPIRIPGLAERVPSMCHTPLYAVWLSTPPRTLDDRGLKGRPQSNVDCAHHVKPAFSEVVVVKAERRK